mmetsp:Transcript_11015/g.23168  ORF Transcript_11015/g.23168 Transcript_11015/m.23168 type:complete len:305 (+) Transcript_11015:55-969(+)
MPATMFGCATCCVPDSSTELQEGVGESPARGPEFKTTGAAPDAVRPAEPPQQDTPRSANPGAGSEGVVTPHQIVVSTTKQQEPLGFWESFGHRMDEDEVLNHAWWCSYCCCAGCGCVSLKAPLECLCNCGFCIQAWQCMQFSEPTKCTCIGTTGCCTLLSQWPMAPGNSQCILVGEDLCGVVGGNVSAVHDNRSSLSSNGVEGGVGFETFDNALAEMFIPCWCGCCGFGAIADCISVCNIFSKCGCCMSRCSSSIPDPEEGLSCLVQAWWCLFQCRLPPHLRSNPICSCCGRSWKTYTHHASRK